MGREAPAPRPRTGVEGVERAVVGADQDELVHDGRPAVDVTAGLRRPRDLSGRRDERVHAAVGRADVDAPVGDRGRGVEMALPEPAVGAEPRGLPAPHAVARRVAVDVAVVGAHDEQAAAVGRRALDRAADVHAPAPVARARVEGRERAVLGAEIERSVDEQGRGLRPRSHAVAPHALAAAAAQREHDASERRDVDAAVVECRAGRERGRDPARPAALAGLRVERDDAPLGGLDVHALAVDDRRELGQRVEAGAPDLGERRPLLSLRIVPPVSGVEPPAGPGDGTRAGGRALDDLGIRRGVLRRREIRDGAAMDVLGRAQREPEQRGAADDDHRYEHEPAPAASLPGPRLHPRHPRTVPGAAPEVAPGVDSRRCGVPHALHVLPAVGLALLAAASGAALRAQSSRAAPSALMRVREPRVLAGRDADRVRCPGCPSTGSRRRSWSPTRTAAASARSAPRRSGRACIRRGSPLEREGRDPRPAGAARVARDRAPGGDLPRRPARRTPRAVR